MEKKYQDICEKHIKHWHQLKFSKCLNYLSGDVVKELLIVFREYMKSKEGICEWCGESQAYLVRQVFQSYEKNAVNPILENVLVVKTDYPNGKPSVPENKSVPESVPIEKDVTAPQSSQDAKATEERPKRERKRQPIYTTRK
jgi:hypothetical protein